MMLSSSGGNVRPGTRWLSGVGFPVTWSWM